METRPERFPVSSSPVGGGNGTPGETASSAGGCQGLHTHLAPPTRKVALVSWIPMEPTAKGRPRMTRNGRAYTPSRTVHAEQLLQSHVASQWEGSPVLEGPLSLIVEVRLLRPKSAPKRRAFPAGRPDVDNYAKLALDALNGLVWRDDAQVVELLARKVYADHPGFALTVYTLEPSSSHPEARKVPK